MASRSYLSWRWAESLGLAMLCLTANGCGGDPATPDQKGPDQPTAQAGDPAADPNPQVAPATDKDPKPAENGSQVASVRPEQPDVVIPPPIVVRTTVEQSFFLNGKTRRQTQYNVYSDDSREPHGLFEEWWDSGQTAEEGRYYKGKRVGKWTQWHKNGKVVREVTYRQGQLQGSWSEFREDGTKERDVTYLDHQKQDTWKTYDSTGKRVVGEETYEAGKLNGPLITYYVSGKKSSEMTYADGLLNGALTRWYPNGRTSERAEYRRGKLFGKVTRWSEEGRLLADPSEGGDGS